MPKQSPPNFKDTQVDKESGYDREYDQPRERPGRAERFLYAVYLLTWGCLLGVLGYKTWLWIMGTAVSS